MEYTINFTQEQLQLINAALGEVPFKHAAPLVQHINSEIQKCIASQANVEMHESLPKIK